MLQLLEDQFEAIGAMFSKPADQIKVMFCLVISFPIGMIFKNLSGATTRHIVSVVVSLLFQYLLYKETMFQPILFTIFCYALLKILGRKAGLITLILSLGYLMYFHVQRALYKWGSWEMDLTTILMMHICRWSSFAWAYKDGGSDSSVLTKEQDENKIIELPSFWKYFSYINFYGSVVVGPFFEYKDFDDFMEQRNNYQNIPSCFTIAIGHFLGSFVAIGISIVFTPNYGYYLFESERYLSLGIFQKILFFNFAMLIHRMTYYTGWGLANANVTICGLNYDSRKEKLFERHTKIVSVRPIDQELATSVKDRFDYWNTSCQAWLKNSIYFRVFSPETLKKNPGKASLAANITFLVSSLWHGLYAGYYVGFFYGFLAQQNNKYLFKAKSKLQFLNFKLIGNIWTGDIIGWILATIAINFSACHFALLDFSKGMEFGKQLHYIPNIILIVLFVFFNVTGWGQKSEKKPSKDQVKETPSSDKKDK